MALGFVGFSFSSCTASFLDTESKVELTTANFYRTINDANRALYACYDGWQITTSDNGDTPFYRASTIMSDECLSGGGYNDIYDGFVIDCFDKTKNPSAQNLYELTWKDYYAAVYRCNELLAHEEQIDWENDERTRGTIMGECHALRAILYFDMVRLWENIPLFEVPINENREQADPDDVYALIIKDFKYAIEHIPHDAYPKAESEQNDGRITKYAAEALLARVYLYYTGYYGKEPEDLSKNEVLQGLEDVIASKEFSLVPNFKNLWPAASSVSKPVPNPKPENYEYGWDPNLTTYAGDGNSETVLAQKFNYTQDWNGNLEANMWLVFMGMRTISFSPYGNGWGTCTVHPKMWNMYEKGDTRREASIINYELEGITQHPDFEAYLKDQREYTGYSVKKYTPMAYADGTNAVYGLGLGDMMISNYQDYIVVRYSDVLLMAAELGSVHAKEYLNEVRRRAFTQDDGTISANFVELEPTKDNIMKERQLEFAFEGLRYWDLLRQGVDFAASQIAETGLEVLSGNVPFVLIIDKQNIVAKRGLVQIPYNQILLSNNVLKQNNGW